MRAALSFCISQFQQPFKSCLHACLLSSLFVSEYLPKHPLTFFLTLQRISCLILGNICFKKHSVCRWTLSAEIWLRDQQRHVLAFALFFDKSSGCLQEYYRLQRKERKTWDIISWDQFFAIFFWSCSARVCSSFTGSDAKQGEGDTHL